MRSFLPSKKNKNFLRILSADGALHFFSVKMRGVVPIFRLRRVTAAVCEKGVFFLVGASLWAEQTSAKDVTQKRGGNPLSSCWVGSYCFSFLIPGETEARMTREKERERDKKGGGSARWRLQKRNKKSRSRFPVGLVKRRQGIGFFFQIQFHLISLSLRTENYRLGTLPNISPPPLQHETLWLLVSSIHTDVRHLGKEKNIEHKRRSAHLSLKPATST